MKIWPIIFAIFSFSALASEKAYWIDSHYCGDLDPLTGKTCVLELNNQSENFAIITKGSDKFLAHSDIAIINTKALKPAKQKDVQLVKNHIREGLKIFTIEPSQVRFQSLPR